MCVEVKWCHLSGAIYLFFDTEPVTGLELISWQGCLASEPWGLSCFHFPSTGLTHTTILFSPTVASQH